MLDVKYIALITLCIQNTALILSMRYSRSVRHDTFLDSTIIVCMEGVKLLVATLLVMRDGGSGKDLVGLIRNSGLVALPSVLYVIQNSCQLIAVNHLDASTFSVLSQLKVLTTALCSVAILRTHLSPRKWRALALLVIGCIMVQYRPELSSNSNAPPKSAADIAQSAADAASITIGLTATMAMVWLSGIAGIVIEKLLKNQGGGTGRALSLWERNVQLSFWGVLFAFGTMMARDSEVIIEHGYWQGWSPFAILIVLCQSVGGLVTAVVVKYTNTIIKGFAVGLSVVMTSILSLWLFDTTLTLTFVMGAASVLLSIFNFNEESGTESSSAVAHIPAAQLAKITNGTPCQSRDEEMGPPEKQALIKNVQ